MRKKIAKDLRHYAEQKTVGYSEGTTRKLYRKLKKDYKLTVKPVVSPKFKLSKRQQRNEQLNSGTPA